MKLNLRAKPAKIRSKIEITDEEGNAMYYIQNKAFSFHDTAYLLDADGEGIATITRSALSFYNTHLIVLSGGTTIELRPKRLGMVKSGLDIADLGWRFAGDFAQQSYQLTDDRGQMLARVHKKRVPHHNGYEVEVLDEERMDLIVAVLAALDKMTADRSGTEEVSSGTPGQDDAQS